MSDSNSFSSLIALVDSHLSKTSVQGHSSGDVNNGFPRIPLPSLSGGLNSTNETLSEASLTLSPAPKLALPSLSISESPIQEVLAQQVSNMLKAREKKKQEEQETAQLQNERQKLEDKMRQLKVDEEKDCIIDLVKAVKESRNMECIGYQSQLEATMSSSSSYESLFESKFIDCDEEPEIVKTPEPILPCTTDMSYILAQKVCKGKCSSFGKVLTSRLKPVAAPYLLEKVDSKIVRFNFKTKSPCDLIKEKLRKPQLYNNQNMFDIIGLFPTLGV